MAVLFAPTSSNSFNLSIWIYCCKVLPVVLQLNHNVPASTAVCLLTFGRRMLSFQEQCLDCRYTVHVRKMMCPRADIRSSLQSIFKYAYVFTPTR